MSLPRERMIYSIEEYLELERASAERHEYLDGEIFEMAGESPAHGTICTNLTASVHRQLLGTPCQAFAKDTKVRSGPALQSRPAIKGLFSYPDLVVVCGELKFHDGHQHVITNPKVIVEVLSPATERFDRGMKWMRYQSWLPDLADYVVVSQERPRIEDFHRREEGQWIYSQAMGLDRVLQLTSIGCTLKLSDVYDRVEFPEADELAEDVAEP
jgi:Uma2 family endonuclease